MDCVTGVLLGERLNCYLSGEEGWLENPGLYIILLLQFTFYPLYRFFTPSRSYFQPIF